MRTSTCCVVLMIFGIRLATTSTTTRPKTPAGVGSCQPLTIHDINFAAVRMTGRRVSVLKHQIVCSVPGVYRNTFSQYSIYTRLRCHEGCNDDIEVVQFTVMCHSSTRSYRYPKVKAYKGASIVWRGHDIYDPPPRRTQCGGCADFYSNRQFCGGICSYYYNRAIIIVGFELWLISNNSSYLCISCSEGFTFL